MPKKDTVDKIVGYAGMVCSEPFTYKGKQYEPKALTVSPDIARGYTCPAQCGACCPRFSLDYLISEMRPSEGLIDKEVTINDKTFVIKSDSQNYHRDHFCKYLNKENGRCGIHGYHPFSCDFELIRFAQFANPQQENRVITRLYGRSWNMLRIDNERGTRCTITPITPETILDTKRKLTRLKQWCDYFEIPNKLEKIIEWVGTSKLHKTF